MRFVRQLLVIVVVSCLGELLNRLIPLPVPASIYGLVLMFCALKFRVFPLGAVKETSAFFIEVMPLFFIPPSVALLENLELLKANWWKYFVVSFVSTILVMASSGRATQGIIRLSRRSALKNEKSGGGDEGIS